MCYSTSADKRGIVLLVLALIFAGAVFKGIYDSTHYDLITAEEAMEISASYPEIKKCLEKNLDAKIVHVDYLTYKEVRGIIWVPYGPPTGFWEVIWRIGSGGYHIFVDARTGKIVGKLVFIE